MKKKARIEIEIEYDENISELSDVDVKINNIIGDYKGITLAMISGLFFGIDGDNPISKDDFFRMKVRLQRATASAIISGINSLHKDIDPTLLNNIAAALKSITNLQSIGLAELLGIEKELVNEMNEEYIDEENNSKPHKDERQGDTRPDTTDFL